MGERAHWVVLSVVGHGGAGDDGDCGDDDDDDTVPRDMGWSTQTLLVVRVCNVECVSNAQLAGYVCVYKKNVIQN